jgi:hypothetical protein
MDWVIFDNTSVTETTLKTSLNLVSVYQILRGISERMYKGLAREWSGVAWQGASNLGLGVEFGHEFHGWRLSHNVWCSKVVNMCTFYI